MKARSLSLLALTTLALAAIVAACDPVHTDAVDALGGEEPGVRKGPQHRPGQPCITCHDGALGDPPAFSIAGTVYVYPEKLTPAVGAVVTVADAKGHAYQMRTNQAGNFYVEPTSFSPQYPMSVKIEYGGAVVSMSSLIGRDGSCADCHQDPAGPASAGHIFIPADGGTP